MSDLDLLHRKMRLIEKWMLLVDERLLVLERLKEPTINKRESLEKRVKNLEQAKTFFPMTESKHLALLNNCVDDDEAILHKREIKEVKK